MLIQTIKLFLLCLIFWTGIQFEKARIRGDVNGSSVW